MIKQKASQIFVILSIIMFIITNYMGIRSNNILTWIFLNFLAFLGSFKLYRKLKPHIKVSMPKVQMAKRPADPQSQKVKQPKISKAEKVNAAGTAQPKGLPKENVPIIPTAENMQESTPAVPAKEPPQADTPAEESSQEESKPQRGPFMRVHNASIMLSRMMADMMSYDRPDLPLPDGYGYSFQFPVMAPPYPDTNIEGCMRFQRREDSAIILISAQKGHSGKLHSVIITPPDAPKEEVIRWLRDETSWPIIEHKWWELYADAEED